MQTFLQDQMETGCVCNASHRKHDEEPGSSELAGALAMLGLEHAHIIHEADPDTKVACFFYDLTAMRTSSCLARDCLPATHVMSCQWACWAGDHCVDGWHDRHLLQRDRFHEECYA